MLSAISFMHVTKRFPLYHHVRGGVKTFILNLPRSLRTFSHANSHLALRNVSFDLYQGEVLGIIGRNGAGKSTTLGLAAGVIAPTSGTVEVNGRVSPMLELGGGFHPDLTGRENILLNGVLLGLRRRQVKKKIQAIIEFSELAAFIDEPIRIYSSGMLARLGFSVVAQLDPEILIIDEVLAVGDAPFQAKCFSVMGEFRRKGVSMLFVSHNPGDIQRICDRVVWIDNTTVRKDGPVADVLEEYQASILYSGDRSN
jgi:lipopolysaccharide transport system ATP-binding protein